MLLLSIVGMLGTFALAWFVWYLVVDWKDAEHQLAQERRDLDAPSPVIGSSLDYLVSAKEVRSAALRAKSSGNKEGFGDTDVKIEIALKKLKENLLNAGGLGEGLRAAVGRNENSLEAIRLKNQEGKDIVGTGKDPRQWDSFKRDYEQEISQLDEFLKELEQETEKLEQKRKADLLALEQEHRPEDRKGVSKLMLTFAVLACGVGPLFLAWSTYRIVAHPIQLLAAAAAKSLDQGKPFEMKETGPAEVRSLTKRLGSLVQGLEERVSKRTEQLQAKAAELELEMEQRKELEGQLVFAQKMEAVGQLAAGIAHEVNTPSQYVCDNLRFLKDAVTDLLAAVASPATDGKTTEKPDAEELAFLSENAPGAVDQALQGMERITDIVKSMKNFAYRDSTAVKKPQDLNQAIQATIVVATNEWKYHADLQTDLDTDLPFVPCNVGEINQVVLNLIVNAAHAIRDANQDSAKGVIIVTTRKYDDCVIITIQDNGGGIPVEVQGRVFEPFFTTKEVGVGTGQGLAIAHNVITKSHGGHLWFETELGTGTTFFIRLPLQAAQEPVPA
ncbi:MAG: ATP-binding protein [Opitutales bacterium]